MKTILLLLIMGLASSCSNPFDSSIDLRYEVTGSAELVNITYENLNGGISQLSAMPLPWSVTLSADPGDYVYLSAYNRGETGTVTVTIYEDGDVFKRASSEGAHVTASVGGTL